MRITETFLQVLGEAVVRTLPRERKRSVAEVLSTSLFSAMLLPLSMEITAITLEC